MDTNILVRSLVQDDERQASVARTFLRKAELIAVPLSCLCELSWVLGSVYKFDREQVAAAIRTLALAQNVVADMPAIDAGLALQHNGGDFADGVIAYEGRALGGEIFISFDKKAVALLQHQGHPARLAG